MSRCYKEGVSHRQKEEHKERNRAEFRSLIIFVWSDHGVSGVGPSRRQ